jgi:hypothetical protein
MTENFSFSAPPEEVQFVKDFLERCKRELGLDKSKAIRRAMRTQNSMDAEQNKPITQRIISPALSASIISISNGNGNGKTEEVQPSLQLTTTTRAEQFTTHEKKHWRIITNLNRIAYTNNRNISEDVKLQARQDQIDFYKKNSSMCYVCAELLAKEGPQLEKAIERKRDMEEFARQREEFEQEQLRIEIEDLTQELQAEELEITQEKARLAELEKEMEDQHHKASTAYDMNNRIKQLSDYNKRWADYEKNTLEPFKERVEAHKQKQAHEAKTTATTTRTRG